MVEFPSEPVSAREFFEEVIPAAFAEVELPEGAQENAVKLGVQLDGEGGGEWLFSLVDERLQVERGSRSDAAFSLVQSVEDWRGALWERRGGAIGRQASNLFRPGAVSAEGAPKPELLVPLQSGARTLLLWGATSSQKGQTPADLQRYVQAELSPVVQKVCSRYGCAH